MEKVNEFDLTYRHGDHGPKYFFQGVRYEWGVVRLLAGGTLGTHYHHEVEETFYFPEGEPVMVIDEVRYPVKPGDVFKIAPEETHDIINATDQPIKIIFIKCPFIKGDKVNV